MAQKVVTLELPDTLYESVSEAAEASQRPVESLLVESLNILFQPPPQTSDMQSELDALVSHTDAQLWAVVYRRLAWTQSLRLRELSALGKTRILNDGETAELDALLDLTDRYMLLRSEALLQLKTRGRDIQAYLQQAS